MSSSPSASTCMRPVLCELTSLSIWSIWMPGATSPSFRNQWSRFAFRDGWISGFALRVASHASLCSSALVFQPACLPVEVSYSLIFFLSRRSISASLLLNALMSSCGTPSTSLTTALVLVSCLRVHDQPNRSVSQVLQQVLMHFADLDHAGVDLPTVQRGPYLVG